MNQPRSRRCRQETGVFFGEYYIQGVFQENQSTFSSSSRRMSQRSSAMPKSIAR